MAKYSKEFKLEAIKRAFAPEESVAHVASGHLSPKDQQIRELQMKNKDLQEEKERKMLKMC